MLNNPGRSKVLTISIILSIALTFGSQLLAPNKFTPGNGRDCYVTADNPECPTTVDTTVKRGFPVAYKILIYESPVTAPEDDTASRTILSDTFSPLAFGWSVLIWFGIIFTILSLWTKYMTASIIRDPVIIGLSAVLLMLLTIYQVSGGDSSSRVLIRDCINIFQYGLLVLFSYLLIRPLLQRSIARSTSSSAKVGKTILGVLCSLVIAALIVYIVFALAFSFVL